MAAKHSSGIHAANQHTHTHAMSVYREMPRAQKEPHVHRGLGGIQGEEDSQEGGSIAQQLTDRRQTPQSVVRRNLEHQIPAKVQMGSPERTARLREGRANAAAAHGGDAGETRSEFLHAEDGAE